MVISWWFSRDSSPYKYYWYWFALILSVSAGLLLGFIYIEKIGYGDTILYFQQAKEIADLSNESFLQYLNRLFSNEYPEFKGEYRSEFFAKILSSFLIITGNNYWLASAYLSLISFLGGWILVKVICTNWSALKWPGYIGFMMIPSVIFWSSGVLKDGLANASLFYLCTFVIRFYYQKPISLLEHLSFSIALILLIKIRFYLGAFVVFGIGILILYRLLESYLTPKYIKTAIYLLTGIGLIIAISFMDYNLQFNHLPHSIYLNYQSISESSLNQNAILFNLDPTWISLIKNLPKSLFYGLFGPLPGQGTSSSMPYWFENALALILFFISTFLLFKEKNRFPVSLIHLLVIGYIVITLSFLPLAAPNYGTLMRYKSAVLPFLWMLLLYFPIHYFFRKKSS